MNHGLIFRETRLAKKRLLNREILRKVGRVIEERYAWKKTECVVYSWNHYCVKHKALNYANIINNCKSIFKDLRLRILQFWFLKFLHVWYTLFSVWRKWCEQLSEIIWRIFVTKRKKRIRLKKHCCWHCYGYWQAINLRTFISFHRSKCKAGKFTMPKNFLLLKASQ